MSLNDITWAARTPHTGHYPTDCGRRTPAPPPAEARCDRAPREYDAPVLTGGWRRRALVFVFCVLVAGCTPRPDAAGPVTLVFKHAKILGPSDPVPALLREF